MPESASLIGILSLAFGLGLLHALDADHIMAVSGLASSRPGFRTTLRFCSRWALGHGLVLLLIGAAVLGLGMAIPVSLSRYAEQAVGGVLILIGVYVLWDLARRGVRIQFHTHAGLPRHAHWHEQSKHQDVDRHQHGAVMVGMLHGTAGSAPLLALLPITTQHSVWYGMAYLMVFGLGVLTTMLIFGGALGTVFRWLQHSGARVMLTLRALIALSSIGFGGYLLYGVL